MKEVLKRPDLNIHEPRLEKPFFLPLDFDEKQLNSEYREVQYENPYVVTIYFGGRYGENPDTQLFNYDTLKLRMYEQKPKNGMFILPLDSQCVFEVKTVANYGAMDRKTSKKRSGETMPGPLYSPLISGGVIKALSSREFDYFNVAKNDGVPEELDGVLNRHHPDNIVPLAATTYKRLHYTRDNERLTIDRNLSFYECIQVGADLVFVRKHQSNLPVVEVKYDQNEDLSYFEKNFMNSSVIPLRPEETKGVRLRKMLLEESRLSYSEPELDLKNEEEWIVMERELKLDTSIDPRTYLRTLDLSEGEVLLGNSTDNITYQYFFLGGEGSVCVMSRSLDPNSPRVIKYKTDLEDKNGVLVREESVVPYNEENLTEILTKLGYDPIQAKTSPIFSRNRSERKVYFQSTGNVFTVYADHCSVEKIDPRYDEKAWLPLNQIEIEYEGKILSGQEDIIPNSTDLLDNEFQIITKIIYETATSAGQEPNNRMTRKYEWISSQS